MKSLFISYPKEIFKMGFSKMARSPWPYFIQNDYGDCLCNITFYQAPSPRVYSHATHQVPHFLPLILG